MKNFTIVVGLFALLVVPLFLASFFSLTYYVLQDSSLIAANLESGIVWRYTFPLFSALAALIIADVWVLASFYTASKELAKLEDGMYSHESYESSKIYTLSYLAEPKNPFITVLANYGLSFVLFIFLILSTFAVVNIIETPGTLFFILFTSFMLTLLDLGLKFYVFYLRYSYHVSFIFDYTTTSLQILKIRLMLLQSLKEYSFDEVNGFSLDTVYLELPFKKGPIERGFDVYLDVGKERIKLFYLSKHKLEPFLGFMKRVKSENSGVVPEFKSSSVVINPDDN